MIQNGEKITQNDPIWPQNPKTPKPQNPMGDSQGFGGVGMLKRINPSAGTVSEFIVAFWNKNDAV